MHEFAPRDLVTTREAAALLGVGTTSVKRWADQGRLPCVRTAGGHRRFSRAAVLSFGRPDAPSAPVDAERPGSEWLTSWTSRFVETECPEELQAALAREQARWDSWAEVADALGGVLEELGRQWSTGEISVVQEHLASSRLARAAHVAGRSFPVPDGAPRALLAAAQNDDHTLALALCEPALRERGWLPLWLGARAPTPDLCRFIAERRPELVLMSASSYSTDDAALAAQARHVGEACRRAGAVFAVGGRGHWPELIAGGHRLHRVVELIPILSSAAASAGEPAGRADARA